MMADDAYSTIRDILGAFIGQRLVDITQHDEEEWEEDGQSTIYFHFENGGTIEFAMPAEAGDGPFLRITDAPIGPAPPHA
jgi:hypothetical protein